ncbi:hypothetical protein AAG906_014888 [Vitis piasezkii]
MGQIDNEGSKANARALFSIFNGACPNEFPKIANCKRAKEAWEILQVTHEVRKILRSLLKKFRPKVTAIEESKDIDSMRFDELIGFIQTYEITLPSSQKPKYYTFKASENEKKDIEIIKMIMKFNKKFYKNQESGKEKTPNEQTSKENDKGFSKGLGHFVTNCPSLKDIKKFMQATWRDANYEDSNFTTFEDARYDPNDFLAFTASVKFVHDSDSYNEFTNDQKAKF